MKKLLLLAAIVFNFLQLNPVKASHVLGGEMWFNCLGNGIYQFTVILYRDCSGIPWDQASITVQNMNGLPNFVCSRLPAAEGVADLSQRCFQNTTFSCGSNPTAGIGPSGTIAMQVYRGTVNLANAPVPPVSGYVFYANNIPSNVRNSNQNMGGGSAMTIRTIMYPFFDASAGRMLTPAELCDNAAEPGDFPVALQLLNPSDTVSITNFSYDRDLDSLSYHIDFPWSTVNTPMFYTGGFSTSNPWPGILPIATSTGNVAIHPEVGMIHFRPMQLGNWLTCFRVDSWRAGQRISSTFRDFQMQVISNAVGLPLYNPTNPSLLHQRRPFINTPVRPGLHTYYVADTIDWAFEVNDLFPAFSGVPSDTASWLPVLNSVRFGMLGQQVSSQSRPDIGCNQPPCAVVRPIHDTNVQGPAALPAQPVIFGNNQPLGRGYFAINNGAIRMTWIPDSSNLRAGLSAAEHYFRFAAVDSNCPIEGRELLNYGIRLVELPRIPVRIDSLVATAAGQNRLRFTVMLDTVSIDPIDTMTPRQVNWPADLPALRAKAAARRMLSFSELKIFKSLGTGGIFIHVASITDPFVTSWTDTTNMPGNTYYVQVVSTSRLTPWNSDTLNLGCIAPLVDAPFGEFYCDANGSVLRATSSGSFTYQWYLNNQILAGATADTLHVTVPGSYNVSLTDSASCTSFSEAWSMEPMSNVLNTPVLCAVSVDTATHRPMLIWNSASIPRFAQELVLYAQRSNQQFDSVFSLSRTVAPINFGFDLSYTGGPLPAYRIGVRDSCGQLSGLSEIHRPIYLTANPLPNRSVELEWTSYQGPGVYVSAIGIYRSTGAGMQPLAFMPPSTTSFFDSSEAMGPRTYVVSVISSSCTPLGLPGTSSNLFSNMVAVGVGAGIETDKLPEPKIYPNPSNGSFTINADALITSIQVFDMQGRLVHFEHTGNSSSSVEVKLTLNEGVYLVEVATSNGASRKRLIIRN